MRIVFNARFALQRKIAWLLLFSFCSLSFIGWLIFFNRNNVKNTSYWINHTYDVIIQIDKTITRISAWDSGSGRSPNATFYADLGKNIGDRLKLTNDNPDQKRLALGHYVALTTVPPA